MNNEKVIIFTQYVEMGKLIQQLISKKFKTEVLFLHGSQTLKEKTEIINTFQEDPDYKIFVAEVASTVNEILLIKYLISKEQDVNVKKYLLSYYLDTIRTTLFRQTMFAPSSSTRYCAFSSKPRRQMRCSL